MSDKINENNDEEIKDIMDTEERQQVVPVFIEDEIKASYLDYSMSVIVSRALPDVRDGLMINRLKNLLESLGKF